MHTGTLMAKILISAQQALIFPRDLRLRQVSLDLLNGRSG